MAIKLRIAVVDQPNGQHLALPYSWPGRRHISVDAPGRRYYSRIGFNYMHSNGLDSLLSPTLLDAERPAFISIMSFCCVTARGGNGRIPGVVRLQLVQDGRLSRLEYDPGDVVKSHALHDELSRGRQSYRSRRWFLRAILGVCPSVLPFLSLRVSRTTRSYVQIWPLHIDQAESFMRLDGKNRQSISTR